MTKLPFIEDFINIEINVGRFFSEKRKKLLAKTIDDLIIIWDPAKASKDKDK